VAVSKVCGLERKRLERKRPACKRRASDVRLFALRAQCKRDACAPVNSSVLTAELMATCFVIKDQSVSGIRSKR
jgi:hypothetical protein